MFGQVGPVGQLPQQDRHVAEESHSEEQSVNDAQDKVRAE